MSKKLTIDQLMALERLTGKEYTLTGTPRKIPRSIYDSHYIGITREHHIMIKTTMIKNSHSMDSIFTQIMLRATEKTSWPE